MYISEKRRGLQLDLDKSCEAIDFKRGRGMMVVP